MPARLACCSGGVTESASAAEMTIASTPFWISALMNSVWAAPVASVGPTCSHFAAELRAGLLGADEGGVEVRVVDRLRDDGDLQARLQSAGRPRRSMRPRPCWRPGLPRRCRPPRGSYRRPCRTRSPRGRRWRPRRGSVNLLCTGVLLSCFGRATGWVPQRRAWGRSTGHRCCVTRHPSRRCTGRGPKAGCGRSLRSDRRFGAGARANAGDDRRDHDGGEQQRAGDDGQLVGGEAR